MLKPSLFAPDDCIFCWRAVAVIRWTRVIVVVAQQNTKKNLQILYQVYQMTAKSAYCQFFQWKIPHGLYFPPYYGILSPIAR